MSELTFIGEHERQRGVEIGDEPALGKPRLVAQELERLLDQDVDLRGRAAASRIAHELQEASGDLLAAVGLLLDELKVSREILEGVETGELGDLRALHQRLRAAGDGRQRIVQLVGHPRGEPPGRAQPLGQEHLALEALLHRDVFDQHDRVRRLAAGPVQRRRCQPKRARLRSGDHLLLRPAHLARGEHPRQELADARRLRGREELDERAPASGLEREQRRPFTVGADHPELPVEHEEPEGQRFQHDFHEPLLLVHLARARGHHRFELLRVGPHRAE